MNRRRRIGIFVLLAVAVAIALWCYFRSAATLRPTDLVVGRCPQIDPDYAGCTIPPNMAPLNFVVKEPGTEYGVRVYSKEGEGFVISSAAAQIVIPMDEWQSLLELNRGNELYFDVLVKGKRGRWQRFFTIVNSIARENVDSYVVYRRIKPVHTIFTNMGTYQRNVSTYRESPILRSGPESNRCVNCHTFVNNDPDTMCLHVRGPGNVAMILARDGNARRIDTRTSFNAKPASYTAWHPSGRLAAFAAIDVIQFHHSVGNSRDVMDLASDVCLYIVDANRVTSTADISDPDRLETFPTWSPDGKHLYFCSAKKPWTEGPRRVPSSYRKVRYDLMRISYDIADGTWGKLETVLSSEETGLSINEPRISPDGRFLLFCMSEYGSFPVFQRSSDLYMMDLKSQRYWPLEINSDRSDSWHGWSTNSRWIVFASKRGDGLFGRVYFSYVDPDGKAQKPVLLPQQDPTFYNSFLENFNAPELITKPMRIGEEELSRAIEADEEQQKATFVEMLPASVAGSGRRDAKEPAAPEPRGAVKVNLDEAYRYFRLGQASEKEGKIEKAVEYYSLSIRCLPELHPANVFALDHLAWIYSTAPSDQIRNGPEAMRLATCACRSAILQAKHARNERGRKRAEAIRPPLLDTLAAAYAECGDFSSAVRTATEAETLALRQGNIDSAVKIHGRLELYLSDKPYRTTASGKMGHAVNSE